MLPHNQNRPLMKEGITMAAKLTNAQLEALAQFKSGKLDQAALLELLKDKSEFSCDALVWEKKPIIRFNFDPSKPESRFNGKRVGAKLVRQILDNADAVRFAVERAEEMANQ